MQLRSPAGCGGEGCGFKRAGEVKNGKLKTDSVQVESTFCLRKSKMAELSSFTKHPFTKSPNQTSKNQKIRNHYRRMKKLLSTLLFLLFVSSAIHAQDILKGKDLSQVKVDQLSDGDIAKLKSQLTSNGMPIEQAEQAAIAKGMSKAEFAKLKLRLEATTDATGTGKLKTAIAKPTTRTNNSSDSLDTGKYDEEKKVKPLIDPLIFGSELFTAVAPNFEPNMKLATPLNYMLGPDDQIQVSVYGVQEYNGELLVSAEGNILVPNVGQIKVAGLTIEAATQKLKSIMGSGVYTQY